MEAVYGARSDHRSSSSGITLGERDMNRAEQRPEPQATTASSASAWEYTPSGDYSFYSYYKPALVLETLEGYLGEQTMARIMRT